MTVQLTTGLERLKNAPGNFPLYFNNQGLFDDHFLQFTLPGLEDHSSKVSNHQLLLDFWNSNEFDSQKFNYAFQEITDLYKKKEKSLKGLDESQLEEEFIKPILSMLGWTFTVQYKYKLETKNIRKPDYALFQNEDDKELCKEAKGNTGFKFLSAVADAKKWTVDLDGKGTTEDNPSYQIVEYMEDTGSQWGILTNGRFWRIYSLKTSDRIKTFYEIDLDSIVEAKDPEIFKYFYNLFRRESLSEISEMPGKCFLDLIFDLGLGYAEYVEENLKFRVFDVVEVIANGVRECASQNKDIVTDEKEIFEGSLYYLFKLIFVLNCESRGLLSVSDTSKYYPSSLRALILNRIIPEFNSGMVWTSRYNTHHYLEELFTLLNVGEHSIGVHGFGSLVFELGQKRLKLNIKISDKYLNKVLLMLSTDKDSKTDLRHFIDYKKLGVDHIGSIFEGILEFSLKDHRGSLVLLNEDGERERTGAFYTPEPIVDYICKHTLPPLEEIKSIDEVLSLRVCDPAMGSGHFLVGVIKNLEEKVFKLQNQSDQSVKKLKNEIIKSEILRNCIYGVDLNPVAVELAKLSLWLYTAEKGHRLTDISSSFCNGNSLLDNDSILNLPFQWSREFPFKFDVMIGNPPYIRNKKIGAGHRNKYKPLYEVATGAYDIYTLFYEKAFACTKKGGRIGFIVSNKLTVADYAKVLREKLFEEHKVTLIVDFTHSKKVFKDAAVVPVITVFENYSTPNAKIAIGTPRLSSLQESIEPSVFVAKATNIIGNNHKIELFKDTTAMQILDHLDELNTLDEAGFEIRTGIMGFEYWDHEPFTKDSVSIKNNWKLITPGLFEPLRNVWGEVPLRLYKSKYSNPMLEKKDNLISGETRKMFDTDKVVIRGVGKGICSFYDQEGCALLVAVHAVNRPKYPYFTTFLFNTLLVDWIYAVKLLAGKIPQGSLKYPVDFLKNEIPFKEVGILAVEKELKKIYESSLPVEDKLNKANEIILKHYDIPKTLWSYMQDKVNETIETTYSVNTTVQKGRRVS